MGAAPVQEGQEQQGRETVSHRLAAGVRIVAEDAVGGEGGTYEGAGEGGEKGSAQGG